MKTVANELISKLTTMSIDDVNKLSNITSYVIEDSVLESVLNNEDKTTIDLDYGTLFILHTDSEVKFKFQPSAKLQESIINAIKTKTSSLEIAVDDILKERLLHTYKDLL